MNLRAIDYEDGGGSGWTFYQRKNRKVFSQCWVNDWMCVSASYS